MSLNFDLVRKSAVEYKPAHLLLFHGSGAKERLGAVRELALVLNCIKENRPCGECPACKKIQSGNHPDIHIVKPLKTNIGIEQVLSLQREIYRKISEGKYRICLIDEAHRLTLPAANALLKIAEEPPDNTVIILSSGNAEGVIPTLQSRAQAVFFPSPDEAAWRDEVEAFRLGGTDPDLARRIEEYGIEKVKELIKKYMDIVESGDFLKTLELFLPLERDDCLLFLQSLAVTMKEMVAKGKLSPRFLKEIGNTIEIISKQVNHRLALEVLVLKHISFGGNGIG